MIGEHNITFWSPELDVRLDNALQGDTPLLQKGWSHKAISAERHRDGANTPASEQTWAAQAQGALADTPVVSPEQYHADIKGVLNSMVSNDVAVEEPGADEYEKLISATSKNLLKLKKLAPTLEALKVEHPDLYKIYLLLVDNLAKLLKKVRPQQMQPMRKSLEQELELVEIPVAELVKRIGLPTDDDIAKINDYEHMTSEAPPIFIVDDEIVDGRKRIWAAQRQGKISVPSYLAKTKLQLGHGMSQLPIGTVFQGYRKVLNPETGKPNWRQMLAGMIANPRDGTAISSLEQG